MELDMRGFDTIIMEVGIITEEVDIIMGEEVG